ncbi:hypothetical protein DPSP01_006047 [Paraphaeosphaeria sporulosa]|uniref:Uncharacterized protein n=1 Tax=Paraphaeosphaeria sporulosa TaxID=1460663 RepID=A0A177C9J6_9PLEO|nr:uncharacterized protein CC84DRAFT_1166333 [Paraphaeosphaeria sporulosa]OAG04245.1 hypothetical protein CC84DRAFT_1166333 [Paraphaeosphaeria sporulosa]
MFSYAHSTRSTHLIPQPSDLRLQPPESYLLIQDFLILTCALLYALCYFFYTVRTYSDRTVAGTPLYMATTMAYELYYGLVMTSGESTAMARFERCGFLLWFAMDVVFVGVAVCRCYPRERWGRMAGLLVVGTGMGIAVLRWLGQVWPDEREQLTAYWTGIVLQVPISWGSLILLVQRRNTKGQSLEIWITRYLGCFTAYGVFWWRYLNAPQNWVYVNNFWSWFVILFTLFPETVYPFVYVWAHVQEGKRRGVVANGKLKNS